LNCTAALPRLAQTPHLAAAPALVLLLLLLHIPSDYVQLREVHTRNADDPISIWHASSMGVLVPHGL
jgi:hypothetical protein